MITGPLAISDKTLAVPVIHGSGDFAIAVRRVMLEHDFDCLAVPLPPSFQADTEAALAHLRGTGRGPANTEAARDENWTWALVSPCFPVEPSALHGGGESSGGDGGDDSDGIGERQAAWEAVAIFAKKRASSRLACKSKMIAAREFLPLSSWASHPGRWSP